MFAEINTGFRIYQIFAIYFQVRKATADSLYTALITYDDIASEENAEEIFNILSETLW